MAKKERKQGKVLEGALSVGEIQKVGTTPVKAMPKRGTIYQGVLDSMGKLRKGQEFTVPVPSGLTARDIQNRLGAARRLSPVEAPEGTRFRSSVSEDEKSLVIRCIPLAE